MTGHFGRSCQVIMFRKHFWFFPSEYCRKNIYQLSKNEPVHWRHKRFIRPWRDKKFGCCIRYLSDKLPVITPLLLCILSAHITLTMRVERHLISLGNLLFVLLIEAWWRINHILPRYANQVDPIKLSVDLIVWFLIRSAPRGCMVRQPTTMVNYAQFPWNATQINYKKMRPCGRNFSL